MLTPRLLALAAVLAAAAALPTDDPAPRPITTITNSDVEDAPWLSFPLFGNLFAPLWRLFPSFAETGPKIIADDEKFQVVVNVKKFKKEDLKVKVKGDMILLEGHHETKDGYDISTSQFYHSYLVPENSSASAVKAELTSDGYLIVTAPSSPEDSKEVDRVVPIVETGVPYRTPVLRTDEDKKTTTEDDRKEPTTTPAGLTDATTQDKKDNENEIP